MTDYSWALKLTSDLGSVAILIVALVMAYRLTDKYAEKFLTAFAAQTKAVVEQATAVTGLTAAVQSGQGDQREVLMAVRMLSDRIDQQSKYLETIETYVRERA